MVGDKYQCDIHRWYGMRANEILEGKVADVPNCVRETMPMTMVVPDLNGCYELYRMLIAMAGMPEKNDIPLSSIVRDLPYFAPYSPLEHEMVDKMLDTMGKHPIHLTKESSIEPPDTHKSSPVRQFKDYNK
jgi:hypothetical protein